MTQSQIADKLGLSAVAVSHALRGTSEVSPATRERVQRAARRMGYRLNVSARSMATGRFGAIGFVRSAHAGRSWTPGELLDGVQDAAEEADLRLTVMRLQDERLIDNDKLPAVFREYCVDGLLINYIQRVPKAAVEAFARMKLPHVWINVDHAVDCVRFDDAAAIRLGVRKLLDAGHRRIDYLQLRGGASSHYSVQLRLQAYEAAMREARLRPRVLADGREIADGDPVGRAMRVLKRSRSSAILTYGDPEASSLLLAAAQCGIDVPRDLSIVNIGLERQVPEHLAFLSRVVLPEVQIGQAAVRTLLRKIEQPAESTPVELIAPRWVEGKTLAGAASR